MAGTFSPCRAFQTARFTLCSSSRRLTSPAVLSAFTTVRPISSLTPKSPQASGTRWSADSLMRMDKLKGSQQVRCYASHLGNLGDNVGSTKNSKRLGRGSSSGRGGTSTRGHKGQKARSGNRKPAVYFAGGQTPLHRALPKRGMGLRGGKKSKVLKPQGVGLGRIQEWIEMGRLEVTDGKTVGLKELWESGCVRGKNVFKGGVKVLGNDASDFSLPNISLSVNHISATALRRILSLNGTVTLTYHNPLTLRATLRPQWFFDKGRELPRRVINLRSRKDYERWRDGQVVERESEASIYGFKTPEELREAYEGSGVRRVFGPGFGNGLPVEALSSPLEIPTEEWEDLPSRRNLGDAGSKRTAFLANELAKDGPQAVP